MHIDRYWLRVSATLLIGPLLVAGGIMVFIKAAQYTGDLYDRAVATQTLWPTTTGTVLDTTESNDEGYIYLTVQFAYNVEDKDYSARQRLMVAVRQYGDLNAAKLTYKIGNQVLVHYDPKNPAKAAVDVQTPTHGPNFLYYFLWALGPIMFVAGILFIIGLIKGIISLNL